MRLLLLPWQAGRSPVGSDEPANAVHPVPRQQLDPTSLTSPIGNPPAYEQSDMYSQSYLSNRPCNIEYIGKTRLKLRYSNRVTAPFLPVAEEQP